MPRPVPVTFQDIDPIDSAPASDGAWHRGSVDDAPTASPVKDPDTLPRLLPHPLIQEADGIDLPLALADAWALVRATEFAESPVIRSLFRAGNAASFAGSRVPVPPVRLDDFVSEKARPGFQILHEGPNELVIGAVGRLWRPDAPFVHVEDAKAFAAFTEPGHGKVAWALRCTPVGASRTRLCLELRAAATDEEASRKLRAYFRVVGGPARFIRRLELARIARKASPDQPRDVAEGLGGAAAMLGAFLTPFLRQRREHAGLPEAESARVYPGDELVEAPRWSWTHAIEVARPAEDVWPWVAQIGADRGGFYSYQWLENLIGCEVRNASTVHPEWQAKVRDRISLHPSRPGLPIVAMEPGRWLVAHARTDEAERAAGKPWMEASWLFYVEPLPGGRSRVISRYKCACSDDLATRLQYGEFLLEPIGYAMDRRMLRGIKGRAESAETH